jgi:hypothetical protein
VKLAAFAATLLLLSAPLATFAAGADVRDPAKGAAYESEDLEVRAPGPAWKLNTVVQGAPGVRGAYVFHRNAEKGRNRSSVISFTIENEPVPPEPAKYADGVLAQLSEPPLSFKRGKVSEITVKGMAGVKTDYTDRDNLRHFTQICVKMPDARLLLVVLQSPDAAAFADDLSALRELLDGVSVKPRPALPR